MSGTSSTYYGSLPFYSSQVTG